MPRYYFDADDGALTRDNGGQDLADADAAVARALDLATLYAREAINENGMAAAVVVSVRDITGDIVATVRHVVDVERAGPARVAASAVGESAT